MRFLKHKFAEFHRQCDGATALVLALALPVLVGSVGLGMDVGSWYLAKRNLQNAVDAAAVATAYNLSVANPTQSAMYSTAQSEMTRNGFGADSGITLSVYYAPQSGTYAGDTQSVEIVATQPQTRFFSKLFLGGDPTVQARAVTNRQKTGSACVLALNNAASHALYFQGSTTVDLNNCTGASNSQSTSSIDLSGSSTTNAFSLYSSGGIDQGGSATLTTEEPSVTNGAPIDDPYADLSVPSYSGCDHNNYSSHHTVTLDPGVYCGGMSFNSHANVTLNPGTYIMDGGDFDVKAGAEVTGDGVTIILTSSSGSNYANVSIAGSADVSLTASTSGDFEGILFYQDQNAPPAINKNKLLGGSTTSYTGAIYFPNQEVQFSGNNSAGGGSCTKIVADTITFIGNSYFSNDCPDSVATISTQGIVQLVE